MWSCLNLPPILFLNPSRWDNRQGLTLESKSSQEPTISFLGNGCEILTRSSRAVNLKVYQCGCPTVVCWWMTNNHYLTSSSCSIVMWWRFQKQNETFSDSNHPWKVSAAFFLNSGIDRSVEQGQSVIAPRPKPGPHCYNFPPNITIKLHGLYINSLIIVQQNILP